VSDPHLKGHERPPRADELPPAPDLTPIQQELPLNGAGGVTIP